MKESNIFEVKIRDTYNYLFSYGGQSEFFKNLCENNKFIGSKCSQCGFVWCPPRIHCSNCYSSTEFIDLPDQGEIVTQLQLTTPPLTMKKFTSVLSVALIKLDGSDTCFKAIVIPRGSNLKPGTRVKAKFRKDGTGITTFYFEPV